MTSLPGEMHGQAKLTEKIVRALRRQAMTAAPCSGLVRDAARRYGVSTATISNALHYKTWGHVPGPDVPPFLGGGGGKRRKTCIYGHPLSGDNLRVRVVPSTGYTRHECRTCGARRVREWYARGARY